MITPDNSALVVIDIQGKLASLIYGKESFFTQTERLIKAINLLGIPILWAEQVPDKLGSTSEQVAKLLTQYNPIVKSTFSCTANSSFLNQLEQLDKEYLIVCGIEAHICVYQSVSGLLKMGKQVHVIADAISSRCNENKQIAINRMCAEGAIISNLEMCLFEILGDVSADQFREISQLIK